MNTESYSPVASRLVLGAGSVLCVVLLVTTIVTARQAESLRQELAARDAEIATLKRDGAPTTPLSPPATTAWVEPPVAVAAGTDGASRRGISAGEIEECLSMRSLTSKLDVLLRTYTGYSLKRHNSPLWKSYNLLNDLRNDAVHHGVRVS